MIYLKVVREYDGHRRVYEVESAVGRGEESAELANAFQAAVSALHLRHEFEFAELADAFCEPACAILARLGDLVNWDCLRVLYDPEREPDEPIDGEAVSRLLASTTGQTWVVQPDRPDVALRAVRRRLEASRERLKAMQVAGYEKTMRRTLGELTGELNTLQWVEGLLSGRKEEADEVQLQTDAGDVA